MNKRVIKVAHLVAVGIFLLLVAAAAAA